ncbi:uncharacterized protein LOC128990575 [Macrosteles quadrilineatus]|uniref:uncharacterized protein LOC128990575 n=1 Tax=Macrosteles quadrilineatus TaxID=74068 RepID=UPI0023E323B5|nr:uncharacterized protein LOC128990575 [Macrosteles quadrilineatus]
MTTLKYATVLLFFIISIKDVQVTKTSKKTFPVLYFKTTKSETDKSGKQLFPLLQPQQGTVNCETECSEDDWDFLDIFDSDDDKCAVNCKFTYSGGTTITSTVNKQDNVEKINDKINEKTKKINYDIKMTNDKLNEDTEKINKDIKMINEEIKKKTNKIKEYLENLKKNIKEITKENAVEIKERLTSKTDVIIDVIEIINDNINASTNIINDDKTLIINDINMIKDKINYYRKEINDISY